MTYVPIQGLGTKPKYIPINLQGVDLTPKTDTAQSTPAFLPQNQGYIPLAIGGVKTGFEAVAEPIIGNVIRQTQDIKEFGLKSGPGSNPPTFLPGQTPEAILAEREKVLKATPKLSPQDATKLAVSNVKAESLANSAIGFVGAAGEIKNIKEALVLTKTTEDATKILTNAGVPEDLTKIFAPKFAATTDKKVIQEGITALEDAMKTKVEVPKPPEPLTNFNPDIYVAEQTAKQESARVAETPSTGQKLVNFYNTTKSKIVESNAPIEDVLSQTTKENKITLKPTENITNYIDRVYRSPVLAGQFARDNGLEAVIKNVDSLQNLDQYMIAKQAIAVEKNGIMTGRNLVQDQALIDAFAPKYEPVAQQVNQYSQKLLDYSVESGLVSKETAEALKIKYPDYVPINRIFNELESGQGFNTKSVASLSKQSVVQKLVGSERQIESPISSLLAKTNDAFVQGEKNKAARLLASYEKLPGNPFQLRELAKGETSPSTISFLDNGVKRTFATTKEVSDAAKSLNVQQLNILEKIFAFPVRLAKVGITGINLPFIASNVVKDQVTAAINGSNSLRSSVVNPRVFLEALYNAVGHGDLYQEMVRAGGAGTSFDIARNQVVQTVERIRAGRNLGSKILYTVKHPSELLRAVENVVGRSEELTRIQQYAGEKQALLKQGMSEADATMGAAKAARENTVNFARRGEWGQVLNSTFLYLNASIQGTRTLVRNLATKPISTTAKIVLTVFTPVAVTTMWNLSDPTRAAVYKDIAEYEKQNNIIIIPPNPTKDENGKWNVIKIPLSQEINNITSLARRPIEQSFGLDPVGADEVAIALIGTASPINPTVGSFFSTMTPQAIKPLTEAYANKNFFTGIPQVPSTLEKLSPELQVKPTTSGTAIQIAKLLKQSPIKVEEFISGTMGGVGSQVIHLSDVALAGLDIIPKDQVHGQKIIDAIISRFAKATGGNSDAKSNKQLQDILTQQADERFRTAQEAELLYQELKTLPPNEANQKASDLKNKNPLLFTALQKVVTDTTRGLDYNDRLINQLGVENGERAKFIWTTLGTFATPEEKNNYVKQLQEKHIITPNVFRQLGQLKQNGQ